MARAKKASRVLSNAEKRLAGMKTIDAKLNFGGEISVSSLESKIVAVREKLAKYNELLSQVDDIYADVLSAEKDLSSLSSKLLAGVGMKYGRGSSEYETVSGIRRRRPSRRTTIVAGVAS